MAEDDLDAFFDEVSAAEAEVTEEKDDVQPPPAKKIKRPMGVVVASSSSKTTEHAEDVDVLNALAQAAAATANTTTAAPSTYYTQQQQQLQQHYQSTASSQPSEEEKKQKKKKHHRAAAGRTWVDDTLSDWPEDDYRLFVGNISEDVTDPQLYDHFAKYPSLQMVKIIRDAHGKSKGYGFVSLKEPMECARAIREMDQTWLSSRPVRVKRSDWKDRERNAVKKQKQHSKRHNKRFRA